MHGRDDSVVLVCASSGHYWSVVAPIDWYMTFLDVIIDTHTHRHIFTHERARAEQDVEKESEKRRIKKNWFEDIVQMLDIYYTLDVFLMKNQRMDNVLNTRQARSRLTRTRSIPSLDYTSIKIL